MCQISNLISTNKNVERPISFRGLVEDSTYLDKREDHCSFASDIQYQRRMFH